jgi:hypothetical protein
MTPRLTEIFDRCIVTGTRLSQELLAELIHPDVEGDMKEVRLAFREHDAALAELTGELQILRN